MTKLRTPLSRYPYQILVIAGLACLLQACSDNQPDGYVYQMNGAGITLPASGVEVAVIPGKSRADFFHGPMIEAYRYATADLQSKLAPVCDQALELTSTLQSELDSEMGELRESGALPKTPDACFNMCTERVGLESERDTERAALQTTVNDLNAQISSVRQEIKGLQASRSKKAGDLGRRLSDLKAQRETALDAAAEKIKASVLANFRLSISPSIEYGRRSYSEVRVDLTNGTKYGIKSAEYSRNPTLKGYYRGIEIVSTEVRLPHYDEVGDDATDDLGFSLGYAFKPGAKVRLGVSIGDVPGLNLSTPSGRLLARDRGWQSNGSGYILPDEFRIESFDTSLLVIPDEKGTRTGSTINYSPKKVSFRAEAARNGLPQDAQIARLEKQLANQSFPEDAEIDDRNNIIASLQNQVRDARQEFNTSAIATQITDLTENEETCRTAKANQATLDEQIALISQLNGELSSCASKALDTASVFGAVIKLNSDYDAEIGLPDISATYSLKAKELIMKKLSDSTEKTTLTDINGGYYLDTSPDPENHLLFAEYETSFMTSFWFQPMSLTGDRNELNFIMSETGSFTEFVKDVTFLGRSGASAADFSEIFSLMGYEATNPYAHQRNFQSQAAEAAADLVNLKIANAQSEEEDETIAEDQLETPPLSCKV